MGPRVVVIGGGTGLSVLLRGLKNITDELTAVVVMSDDGGGSGILREEMGMLPPGDIRNCIGALADEEGLMQDLLNHRFKDGNLVGQSFGNLFIAALYEMFGNFETAVMEAGNILKIKGKVIPVTTENINLSAKLKNGEIIRGESHIGEAVSEKNTSIDEIFLSPDKPAATSDAVAAINDAQIIVIGPGSLYTSILPNFLVDGIGEAVYNSGARVIYISNIMTQAGETDGYSVMDHVMEVEKYINKYGNSSGEQKTKHFSGKQSTIEVVIANNKIVDGDTLKKYEEEGSRQMLVSTDEKDILKKKGIRIIANDFLVGEDGYIRHDANRVATVILSLAMAMD